MARRRAIVGAFILGAATLAGLSPAAQAPALKATDLAGAWEGLSKGTNGELPLKVELKVADGKFSGTIGTPIMAVAIVDGRLEGDALTLTIDADGATGTLSAKVLGGRIEGTWQVSSESGTVVLSRPAGGEDRAADPITGEWAGEASVQGQPMPITLFLKLQGDAVSGEIVSAMGRVALTSGSWKDGALVIAFPYAGGEPVTMGAKLQDGRLVGMFDYNSGEVQGAWFAAKK